MIIKKTLTLRAGEGDSTDVVHIQISVNQNTKDTVETAAVVWDRIINALLKSASSLTVDEW